MDRWGPWARRFNFLIGSIQKIIDLGPLELTSGQLNFLKGFIKRIIHFGFLELLGPDSSITFRVRLGKSLMSDLGTLGPDNSIPSRILLRKPSAQRDDLCVIDS